MSARNYLNLKANESPWTSNHNICDSQPIIRLWTHQNVELLVPTSSLLASSPVLKDILSSRDFLPVPYFAPVVILPNVTVDVAKHVVNLVTAGKTYPSNRQEINEVKGALEMLKAENDDIYRDISIFRYIEGF